MLFSLLICLRKTVLFNPILPCTHHHLLHFYPYSYFIKFILRPYSFLHAISISFLSVLMFLLIIFHIIYYCLMLLVFVLASLEQPSLQELFLEEPFSFLVVLSLRVSSFLEALFFSLGELFFSLEELFLFWWGLFLFWSCFLFGFFLIIFFLFIFSFFFFRFSFRFRF